MLARMRRPVLGALVLLAAALGVVLLLTPRPHPITDLEIKNGMSKFLPGQEVSIDLAAGLPKEAYQSYAPPDSPVPVPLGSKEKARLEQRLDLPDLQRAKLVKRGKRPAPRNLKYRFRVQKGWEIYQIPPSFREKYTDTWEAMHLAREATGETVQLSSGREAFRITSMEPGSLLQETGLQPGDVIVSVNGHPVSDTADGRRLYAELKHETRFWVVVDRRGEIVNLYYELEE